MSKLPLLFLGALGVVVACRSPADEGNLCRAELDALPVEDSATVDIEFLIEGIVSRLDAEPVWDGIQAIETECRPPRSLPDLMETPAGSEVPGKPRAKPVQKVVLPGLSGIVFIYPSRGVEEVTTGLAASLVEYRDDGTPGRIYKASELLRDEGWARLTSSNFSPQSIVRCDQEIEYFTYSREGDIAGELAAPTRTPRFCEQIMLLAPGRPGSQRAGPSGDKR